MNRSFDIGGPDVLTHHAMMLRHAAVAGLPRRPVAPVPVLTPACPATGSAWSHTGPAVHRPAAGGVAAARAGLHRIRDVAVRPAPLLARPGPAPGRDSLDFWRVEEIVPERLLRLRAEMRLPGPAQFELGVKRDCLGRTRYRALFGGMARNIALRAREARPPGHSRAPAVGTVGALPLWGYRTSRRQWSRTTGVTSRQPVNAARPLGVPRPVGPS